MTMIIAIKNIICFRPACACAGSCVNSIWIYRTRKRMTTTAAVTAYDHTTMCTPTTTTPTPTATRD